MAEKQKRQQKLHQAKKKILLQEKLLKNSGNHI